MIYELLYPLSHEFGWAGALNVLRYTPFRAIMATLTAMLISFVVAPWFIRKLRGKQISQIIREEGPKSVKSQFQGDEVRVSSKSRDDLQATIQLLKGADFDIDLQFLNFR